MWHAILINILMLYLSKCAGGELYQKWSMKRMRPSAWQIHLHSVWIRSACNLRYGFSEGKKHATQSMALAKVKASLRVLRSPCCCMPLERFSFPSLFPNDRNKWLAFWECRFYIFLSLLVERSIYLLRKQVHWCFICCANEQSCVEWLWSSRNTTQVLVRKSCI